LACVVPPPSLLDAMRGLCTLAIAWSVGVAAGCDVGVADQLDNGVCAQGTKACAIDGVSMCVSLQDPSTGCGRPNCAPCALEHVKANICSHDNTCSIGACTDGWMQCDPQSNGCETQTAFDVNHCGNCMVSCGQVVNGTAQCDTGSCVVGSCTTGSADCNHVFGDGCEVNLLTDRTHCGMCEQACGSAMMCVNGNCQ
jgi:hypothetical protein